MLWASWQWCVPGLCQHRASRVAPRSLCPVSPVSPVAAQPGCGPVNPCMGEGNTVVPGTAVGWTRGVGLMGPCDPQLAPGWQGHLCTPSGAGAVEMLCPDWGVRVPGLPPNPCTPPELDGC